MSSLSNVQLSPRILAAYERLEQAVQSLKKAADAQNGKVAPEELEHLQTRIGELEAENNALKTELGAIDQADMTGQISELRTQLHDADAVRQTLEADNAGLKELTTDVSARLEKLIGNVQLVLEED